MFRKCLLEIGVIAIVCLAAINVMGPHYIGWLQLLAH